MIQFMANKSTILIHNIYYMLSYAFQELGKNNYANIKGEEFEHVMDLFAEILYRGISEQLKQGLFKEYISKSESSSTFRGRLAINGTIRNIIQHKRKLDCEFDELSVDNLYNRILKSTMLLLIRRSEVDSKRKNQLRSILSFFNDIEEVGLKDIRWSGFNFQRNNRNYRMLMNICYFIVDGLLLTTDSGDLRMPAFSEEHMNRLFERFVLNYYKRHYPVLRPNADSIKWNIVAEEDSEGIDLIPSMQSDIALHSKDHKLIIDTKYYGKILQGQFGKRTIHSAHMYQIYAYVKNLDIEQKGNVSGMLLYAQTTEGVMPVLDCNMGGNKIMVRTLDLNKEFSYIQAQLDKIITDVFSI